MSPLRQRMVDAMQMRGLSVRTIECYVESISRLSRHYEGINPARLRPEQIEAYLLHLVRDRKLSYSSVNQAASASRFLFETVLGRCGEEAAHLRPPMAKVPQEQPERTLRLRG
jgi:integrase/recombinase XerD